MNALNEKRENIANDPTTPIPIESTFFLEDGKLDSYKNNRYYFRLPQEWITSNLNEIIVGVRSCNILKKRRRIKFTVGLCKYDIKTFNEYIKGSFHDIITDINKKSTSTLTCKIDITCWIYEDQDLRVLEEAVHQTMVNYVKNQWFSVLNLFAQSESNEEDRDIEFKTFYDTNGYHAEIFSPRNSKDKRYNVAFRIMEYNQDFRDVFFNGVWYSKIGDWQPKITFDNLWDRHDCMVYSSLCTGSNHGYLTITNQQINPIKYFKIQSSDQQFWIELYSCFNHESPPKLPPNEGFFLEMQFQPYNKLLYV